MIEKLIVKNFRSLRDVTIDFKPLTIFIGPNNSGKSNILDVFAFLSEFLENGRSAVDRRGGFDDILWNGDPQENEMSFEIHGCCADIVGLKNQYPERVQFIYSLTLKKHMGRAAIITRERFFIHTRDWDSSEGAGTFAPNVEGAISNKGEGRILLDYPVKKGNNGPMALFYDVNGDEVGGYGITEPQDLHLRVCKDTVRYPVLGHFAIALSRFNIFNLFPEEMKSVTLSSQDYDLKGDGSNLASVLHTIHSESRENFDRIQEFVKAAVPSVKGLKIKLTPDGKTYYATTEDSVTTEIKPWMLPDGTVKLIGCLTALFNPHKPPFMAFEEPENFINFHITELLVNAFEDASSESTLMVTTHSPYLLNFVQPENVRIVDKKDGRTIVKNADSFKNIKEALKDFRLGELWYHGHIGGLQP